MGLYFSLQKSKFVDFAKVSPLNLFGVSLSADEFRQLTGALEVAFAILFVLPVRALKLVGNVGLLAVMVGAVYTHVALGDPFADAMPAAVLLILLGVHLLLSTASSPQEEETEKKKV